MCVCVFFYCGNVYVMATLSAPWSIRTLQTLRNGEGSAPGSWREVDVLTAILIQENIGSLGLCKKMKNAPQTVKMFFFQLEFLLYVPWIQMVFIRSIYFLGAIHDLLGPNSWENPTQKKSIIDKYGFAWAVSCRTPVISSIFCCFLMYFLQTIYLYS